MSDVDSPKVLWESIKARYVGADRVKEARLQTLHSEFDRLKMHETETIDIFAGKFAGIASKSASLGETIDELKLVKKLLKVVPRMFIHLVASLEQVLDLKTVGFEDVVGRLKAYEERIRGEDGGDEQRVKLTRVCCGDAGSSNDAGGGDRSSSYGAGSSNDAGGQRVIFTRSNGGCESSGDGRNTGGGSGGGFGVFSGGFSGSSREKGKWGRFNNQGEVIKDGSGGRCDGGSGVSGVLSREMKWGRNNCGDVINNRDGSSGSSGSGSKPKVLINPTAINPNSPITDPISIPTQTKTIGSNQVQGNAELDRDRRHL